MERGTCQGLGIFKPPVNVGRAGEVPDRYVEGTQNGLSSKTALSLPGIFFTPVASVRDKHEQGNAIQKGQRYNRVYHPLCLFCYAKFGTCHTPLSVSTFLPRPVYYHLDCHRCCRNRESVESWALRCVVHAARGNSCANVLVLVLTSNQPLPEQ